MPIASFDDLLASWVKVPHAFVKRAASSGQGGNSSWLGLGMPSAGSVVTGPNSGVALVSSATPGGGTTGLILGQLPFYDAPVGKNVYLGRLAISSEALCLGNLCDRLWSGPTLLSTAVSQTIDSVPWPARDDDGSSDGVGVRIGLEHNSTSGAGNAPTATISYTNSDGTPGRTGTVSIPSASAYGRLAIFTLQGDDVGVRSVELFQLSQSYGGFANLVAFRVIEELNLAVGNSSMVFGPREFGLPKMFNGSVPFFVFQANAAVAAPVVHFSGTISYVIGD